jgi:hypothetical protein
MDTYDSPGRAEARLATTEPRENQNLDIELLPDRTLVGNSRRKIRIEGGATLYEVFEIHTYFELVSGGSEIERFDSLFDGIVGQIRRAK